MNRSCHSLVSGARFDAESYAAIPCFVNTLFEAHNVIRRDKYQSGVRKGWCAIGFGEHFKSSADSLAQI